MTRIQISEDDWDERFKPVGWEDGPVDEVPEGIDAALVWSCADAADEEDSQLILSGIHSVNRWGYWICSVPVPPGEEYVVVRKREDGDAAG